MSPAQFKQQIKSWMDTNKPLMVAMKLVEVGPDATLLLEFGEDIPHTYPDPIGMYQYMAPENDMLMH
jgi:hypothetical protein